LYFAANFLLIQKKIIQCSKSFFENEKSTKIDSVEFNIGKLQFDFTVLVENPAPVNFDNQISIA